MSGNFRAADGAGRRGVARIGPGWYGGLTSGVPDDEPERRWLSALIVIALVILLLYWSDRLGTVGKGLGEGVKAFRKTLREDAAPPAPRSVQVTAVETKLLPAKGETGGAEPPTDSEGS